MMNVCESIQGALYDEAAEVVNTLWPKGNESGFVANLVRGVIVPSGRYNYAASA